MPLPVGCVGWLEHGLLVMLRDMSGSVAFPVTFLIAPRRPPPAAAQLLTEEDGAVLTLAPPVPGPTRRVRTDDGLHALIDQVAPTLRSASETTSLSP